MAKTKKERMGDIRGRVQILAMAVQGLPAKDSAVPTCDITLDDGTVEAFTISFTRASVAETLRYIYMDLEDWE